MFSSKYGQLKPLVFLRKNAGFSRNKAAVLLDVGLTTLTRYENGDNDVPFGVGEKMTVLYKVPFDDVRLAISDTKKLVAEELCGDNPEGRINKKRKQSTTQKLEAE